MRRRRVTICLRSLSIGCLHFVLRIAEELIDIKSLLFTSGFKEERSSREKNTVEKRFCALSDLLKSERDFLLLAQRVKEERRFVVIN